MNTVLRRINKKDLLYLEKEFPKLSTPRRIEIAVIAFKFSDLRQKLNPELNDSRMDKMLKELNKRWIYG